MIFSSRDPFSTCGAGKGVIVVTSEQISKCELQEDCKKAARDTKLTIDLCYLMREPFIVAVSSEFDIFIVASECKFSGLEYLDHVLQSKEI